MISIIAAVSQNGVIGQNNKLIWHISEDLKRFKALTGGHPVIMGRKTWESLGRALPGRNNVVITSDRDYDAPGATVVSSLEEAIGMFPSTEEVFIIGGGQVYSEAIGFADRMYLTWVHRDYEGDTTFPEFSDSDWKIVSHEYHPHGEKFPYPFEYMDFERADSTADNKLRGAYPKPERSI